MRVESFWTDFWQFDGTCVYNNQLSCNPVSRVCHHWEAQEEQGMGDCGLLTLEIYLTFLRPIPIKCRPTFYHNLLFFAALISALLEAFLKHRRMNITYPKGCVTHLYEV